MRRSVVKIILQYAVYYRQISLETILDISHLGGWKGGGRIFFKTKTPLKTQQRLDLNTAFAILSLGVSKF